MDMTHLMLPLPHLALTTLHPPLLIPLPPPMRKPALKPELLLRDPPPQPYKPLHNREENAYPHRDPKDVRRHQRALQGRVEEAVGVEALGGVRQVREGEVQRDEEEQEGQVRPRRGPRARQRDLEEREGAVEDVLRDVAPRRVGRRQRRRGAEQRPEDDHHEQGVGGYGAVVHGVQALQRPGEVVEGSAPAPRVQEGVGC